MLFSLSFLPSLRQALAWDLGLICPVLLFSGSPWHFWSPSCGEFTDVWED